jgi:3-phenylpropionate/cinnamic acid dioxygenase small subunit
MPAGPDTAALERRLARLEAERAIARTLHRYAHTIDAGDEAGWLACFTDTAVFAARHRDSDRHHLYAEGREALAAFIAAHTRPPEQFHQHVVVDPVIDAGDGAARSTSGFFVLMRHETRPLVRVFGHYHDVLVPAPGGAEWRFERREAVIETFDDRLPPLAYGRPG